MNRHFIWFKKWPLIYGRVPKVANSSIKASLCRLLEQKPVKGIRTTSDAFWSQGTHGETSMLGHQEAIMCRGTHFCFSFVRNPFDRLVSAFNNKIVELDVIPGPMQKMGLTKGMTFTSFLECIAATNDDDLDVHLLPQSTILYQNSKLIPDFIGKLEQMEHDWAELQVRLKQEGIANLGKLPQKNRRRSDNCSDLKNYFSDPGLIRLAADRFQDDLNLFYEELDLNQISR